MQSDFYIQHWSYLFESFKGGPDWGLEKPLAMAGILRWRIAILEEQRRWKCQIAKQQNIYNKAMEQYKSARRFESYFKPNPGRYCFFYSEMKYVTFEFL